MHDYDRYKAMHFSLIVAAIISWMVMTAIVLTYGIATGHDLIFVVFQGLFTLSAIILIRAPSVVGRKEAVKMWKGWYCRMRQRISMRSVRKMEQTLGKVREGDILITRAGSIYRVSVAAAYDHTHHHYEWHLRRMAGLGADNIQFNAEGMQMIFRKPSGLEILYLRQKGIIRL